MNRLESALEHANIARALRPNDVVILRARAVALFYLQRPAEAQRQVLDVAMLMPRSIMDDWVRAGADVMTGNHDTRQLAAVIERGPVILREIDTARLYGMINDPRTAARHLERAFRADPSCVTFVAQSPAFLPFRNPTAIESVMRKYRAP